MIWQNDIDYRHGVRRKCWSWFYVGLFLGMVLVVGVTLLIEDRMMAQREAEIRSLQTDAVIMQARLEACREELGILHGVLTSVFGKNTGVVVEQFRRKKK